MSQVAIRTPKQPPPSQNCDNCDHFTEKKKCDLVGRKMNPLYYGCSFWLAKDVRKILERKSRGRKAKA